MRSKIVLLFGVLGIFVAMSGFRPFLQVTNVCPTCKTGPRFDTVMLTTGAKVLSDVVAQNDDYYVLKRFGEFRMVKKTDVSSVEWKTKTPPTLVTGDQVLLHSGIAFHGTISTVEKGRFITIQSGKFAHTVWSSLILTAYRGGKPVVFK